MCTVAWPSAEIGAMGVEGAVNLGFKKELAAAAAEGGEDAKKKLFDKLCAIAHARQTATNAASQLEVDDVIDPMDTRARLDLCLKGVAVGTPKKQVLDSW